MLRIPTLNFKLLSHILQKDGSFIYCLSCVPSSSSVFLEMRSTQHPKQMSIDFHGPFFVCPGTSLKSLLNLTILLFQVFYRSCLFTNDALKQTYQFWVYLTKILLVRSHPLSIYRLQSPTSESCHFSLIDIRLPVIVFQAYWGVSRLLLCPGDRA